MMGWSVGVFIVESLSVRASGSVRDHEVPSRPPLILARDLKDGRFRSLRDSSRRLLCSHLTGALVRPRRCALHLWGFWGSLPCALVAALPSFRSIHSWSSGLSTRIKVCCCSTQRAHTVVKVYRTRVQYSTDYFTETTAVKSYAR